MRVNVGDVIGSMVYCQKIAIKEDDGKDFFEPDAQFIFRGEVYKFCLDRHLELDDRLCRRYIRSIVADPDGGEIIITLLK